ncbi:MAG TPA: hypothetical protein VMP11_08225 [Verrucomicrobiae bacterium]|nr:hypothetical protein [Verrucomicrobiae bacterium]
MDTFAKFSFYGSLGLPPIVFACMMWRLRRFRFLRRFLVSILSSSAVFALLLILAWSIFFRDGWGPDSDPTTYGMEAFAKCWIDIVFAIIVGVALMAFGIVLARPNRKESIPKIPN